jgi:hypothetical protein
VALATHRAAVSVICRRGRRRAVMHADAAPIDRLTRAVAADPPVREPQQRQADQRRAGEQSRDHETSARPDPLCDTLFGKRLLSHRPDSFPAALAHVCVPRCQSTLSGEPPFRASIVRDDDPRDRVHPPSVWPAMPHELAGHPTQAPKLLPPLSAAVRSRARMARPIGDTLSHILVHSRPITPWQDAFKPRSAIPPSEARAKAHGRAVRL